METGSLRNSIVFIIFNGESVFNRFLGNSWSNLNVAINVRHLEHPEISYFNTKSLKSHKCVPGFHVQIGGFSYYNGLLFTPGSFSSHIIRTGWFLVFNFDFRALHPPNSFFFFHHNHGSKVFSLQVVQSRSLISAHALFFHS